MPVGIERFYGMTQIIKTNITLPQELVIHSIGKFSTTRFKSFTILCIIL